MQFLQKILPHLPPRLISFWTRWRPELQLERLTYRGGALVVLVFAFLYYLRYYDAGLNLGGEGGTVAVGAMRIMEGQRPIADTFLGYNVMWFYPVVWLFQVFGPNYIALRIFFFALCTITGLMAFYIVRRVTGHGWYAILAALGPVLIPGMLFRNYMGLLAVLNMLTLLQAYVFEQRSVRRRVLWMVASGAALGLTYLVRIDLGAFFTIITVGLVLLFPFGAGNWKLAGTGLLLAVVMFSALHLPFYLDAQRRGYTNVFVGQYTGWIGLIRWLAVQEVEKKPDVKKEKKASPPVAVATPTPLPAPTATTTPQPSPAIVPAPPPAAPTPEPLKPQAKDVDSESYLQKRPLERLFKATTPADEKVFVLITYLPIPTALLIVLPSGILLLVALVRRNAMLRTEAFCMLIPTGAALTLFAQYFFFRPDTPHLSEFMVPFMVAMACACWVTVRWARRCAAGKVYCAVIIVFCAADTGLYFSQSYYKESAGTVAAKYKRNHLLVAENGVRVKLKKAEQEDLQKLCDLIKTHTSKGEYVVCYPYAPTINFMTDRPSYRYNLYVDNAHNVSSFYKDTVAEMGKYKPAAIIIDNRDINQTEESRFANWASATYDYIRTNYRYAGTFKRQEVYLRPDKFSP